MKHKERFHQSMNGIGKYTDVKEFAYNVCKEREMKDVEGFSVGGEPSDVKVTVKGSLSDILDKTGMIKPVSEEE